MVAKCSSCVNRENCEESLKDATTCRRYHTRVRLTWDGKNVQFHCPINNKFSDWYKREALSENVELLDEIATKLDVRPKDVYPLLLKDDIPRKRSMTSAPEFDLSEHLAGEDLEDCRDKVASWLMENYDFVTIRGRKRDVIYVYKDGVYVPEGEVIIIEAIRRALRYQCNTFQRNETIAIIRDTTLKKMEIFTHNSTPKICLENGILNLDTGEFTDHTPKEYFLAKIPVTYDLEATCPNIDKFHSEIVDKTSTQTLDEIIGYCLYRGYPIQKWFILFGGGRNGKGTWLNMLQAFLGKENCSSLSLQKLSYGRFATAALVGKYANIHNDLPNTALKQTGTIKQLTGGDPIDAERKFGANFNFSNFCKLLFSCNQIPAAPTDQSDAYFRRPFIIDFPNVFSTEANAERKADPNILKKLTTKKEFSGLLNKATKALSQLLKNNRFHGDKTPDEWREIYIRKSDPIGAFVLDCCEEINDPEAYIIKPDLYTAFVNYCKIRKLSIVTTTQFSQQIKTKFTLAQESTIGRRGQRRKQVWRNLCLIDYEGETSNQKILKFNDEQEKGFIHRQIPPAERCEFCGKHAVEHEIIDLSAGRQCLRQCQECYEKFRKKFEDCKWRESEE